MEKNYNKDIVDWKAFPAYDMIWCDPPWEDRMVRYFRTDMVKKTGEGFETTLEQMLHHLGKLADSSKPMVVEYSIKGHEYVIQVLESRGHKLVNKVVTTQSNNKPYLIMIFNKAVLIDINLSGFRQVTDAVQRSKARVIFDPFAGIGATAKAVQKAGATYIGSEVNPARFKRLCKANP